MSSRRVVVTGLGLVTPLGTGVKQTWDRLIAGGSGIVSLVGSPSAPVNSEQGVDYSDLPSQVAGLVQRGEGTGEFDMHAWVPKSDISKTTPFMHFAYSAAQQALEDAEWFPKSETLLQKTGVCVGSGFGAADEIAYTTLMLKKGYKKVGPHFIPRSLVNMAAGNLSIRYGFQGPNHAVSTACATGAHAIGDAMRFIQYGDADVMLAGATEASISPLGVAGFCRARALATLFNDRPSEASRPFDKDRDGFVIGEGAGIVVLEEYEHAKSRGAKIYAELCGYGLTGDAFHITSPHSEGRGAARAMKRALETARLRPSDIGYVNAHATGTPTGDVIEAKAITTVLQPTAANPIAVSSIKGAIGHLLGASGSVEAIATILSIHQGVVPPTLNLNNLDPELTPLHLDFVTPQSNLNEPIHAALSNSFGFGGTNASLCFAKL